MPCSKIFSKKDFPSFKDQRRKLTFDDLMCAFHSIRVQHFLRRFGLRHRLLLLATTSVIPTPANAKKVTTTLQQLSGQLSPTSN